MLVAIILIVILYFLNQPIISSFKARNKAVSVSLLNRLFLYHIIFWAIYYAYATFNPSDSKRYYWDSFRHTGSWSEFYETGTNFIKFLAYPFTNLLSFPYEAIMVLFAWLGFIGFIYFYILFIENIKIPLKFRGFNLITLLLFLPNMHFWTASLGKGSLIFLGIAMFAYGLSKPKERIITLAIGIIIVYHVRPHMMMFLAVGAVAGYITGSEKVPLYQKLIMYLGFIIGGIIIYDDLLAVANLNEEDVLGSFQNFSQMQADRLSGAGSGLDIASYPLPLKLFTFWFRPLFFDAPGALGLYISVENLFYLALAWKLVDKDFIPFLKKSSSLVKMSLVTFIASSIALSMVMANLGIVIRQKSMVMYFFFFIILAFMEYKQRKKTGMSEMGEAMTTTPRKRLKLV